LLPPDFQQRLRQFEDRMQRRFGRNAPPPPGAAPGAPVPPGPPSQRGAVGAPVLGVAVQDVSGQFAGYLKVPDGQGVLITDVQAGSAAEKGGLHAGDVIIAVDGQRVRNAGELRAQVRRSNETRTAALRVIRNGAETTVNVEISAAPRPGAGANDRPSTPI
jgi:serine protease Do